MEIDPQGAQEIAARPGTPNRQPVPAPGSDFAQVCADGVITGGCQPGSGRLEVDRLGLDAIDRRMLTAIIQNWRRPLGLETLAATIGEGL